MRERILQAIATSDPQRRGFVLNEALRTNRAVSFSDLMTDLAPFIEAERDARDAAWARLVKAALDEVSTTDAREALRAMGVDVDSLLEGS